MKGPMTPGRPVGVTLYVRDSGAATSFYEAALGLRWNPDISSFQFGDFPGDDFFLVSLLDPADEPDHPIGAGHIGFVVEHLEEAHRRALDAGAVEWYTPQDNAGAPSSSGVCDPDGNRVELWQA
jgi:catechol 2,3-dioxygenase-like lactoylglutathione lyase family enzyme